MVRSPSITRSAPKRPASRASSRRLRAKRRSWSCPTSKPATCSRRTYVSLGSRCRRHRAWRARARHLDVEGGQPADAHGVLRRGHASRLQPEAKRADPGLSHDRNHPRGQRRQLEHQVSVVRCRCHDQLKRRLQRTDRGRRRASADLSPNVEGKTLVDETWPTAEVSDVPAALDKVIAFLRRQIGGSLPAADRPSRRAWRSRL